MKNKELIILLIILALATFFRLWQLNAIPPGLYPDVAMNGNDVLDTLQTNNFKVFYPENNGREGLFMWLIALSFSVFGVSVWSIKIVAAIIGILTVLGLYLLTKELFKPTEAGPLLALLASFFLATSFWHVLFSRLGFRAIMLPFILVFGFYFLWKGLRVKKVWPFIIAGIFFGAGFYTYISYRFIVILLPIVLFCWWLIYRKENLQKKFFFLTTICLITSFMVALPIGIYFLTHPQDFVGRATPVSIFATDNPLKEFGKSLILHLGMFNIYGDANWRHNYAGSPELFWPIGILFLIGFFVSIKNLIYSLKNKNRSLFAVHCLLLSWFFLFLLPGILTAEGVPHALRVIGVIPVVFIFASLGGEFLYQKIKKLIKIPPTGLYRGLIILALCLLVFTLILAQFLQYFNLWANNPNVEGAYTKKFADIGYILNSLPDNTKKYVIVNESGAPVPWPNGLPMPSQTPMFIERMKYGQIRSTYLTSDQLNKIKVLPSQNSVVIPMAYDEKIFNQLKSMYPWGNTVQVSKDIWAFVF